MVKNIVIAVLAVAAVISCATLVAQAVPEREAENSVQIAARRLDDGRVEFGLRQRLGDGWSDIAFPSQRYLPVDTPVGEWRITDEIAVAATKVDIRLRDGVYVGDYHDEFLVYVDGQVYESNCGELRLDIVSDTVLFETQDAECDKWVGLATACGSAETECDLQQAMVYLWEEEQRDTYGFDEIELSLDDGQTIVDAIWRDYVGGERQPPAVVPRSRSTTSFYSSSDHTIYLSEWGRDLDTVLHEVTHAIIAAGAPLAGGHDRQYAAQILDVWQRYAPIIDIAGARLAAPEFGVDVATVTPVRASADSEADVIWSVICTEPVRSEPYCDALNGAMHVPVRSPTISGAFEPVVQDGRIDTGKWYWTQLQADASVSTSLVSEASIDERTDLVARLQIECSEDQLGALIWWQFDRGFSTSVLVRLGDEDFRRQEWTRGVGTWERNGVETRFRVAYAPNDDRFVKDLMWASSAGESFTIQVRSGADVHTATFDLDGLFETPVQPNVARCGR